MTDQDYYEIWKLPLVLPNNAAKRSAMMALGRLMVTLRPAAARRIEAQGKPQTLGERLLLAGLVAKHRNAGTLDRLAHLHKDYWQGQQATTYHAERSNRLLPQFLRLHSGIVDVLNRQLAGSGIHSLVEVGCGSGLLVEYLSTKLPLQRFVGLDLSTEQIRINRARSAGARVEFDAGDLTTWIPGHCGPGWVYFSYGGVLEYLTQPQLETLFRWTSSNRPSIVALVEPIGDFDLDRETVSRPYGREYSFGHNYPRALQAAGYRVVHQERSMSNFLLVVAHL